MSKMFADLDYEKVVHGKYCNCAECLAWRGGELDNENSNGEK